MYIDGFLIPVGPGARDKYVEMARKAAALFRANGATRVVEAWPDDVPVGERTSFTRAVQLEDGESVVFSWIEYPDRATRDACMKVVMADPSMQDMSDMPFDGRRMIFGGFEAVIDE